jgi:hypothetical protein
VVVKEALAGSAKGWDAGGKECDGSTCSYALPLPLAAALGGYAIP